MKELAYRNVHKRVIEFTQGECDEIAIMSTIVCELFHGIPWIDWVGFYRLIDKSTLKIGPYQGQHACITIPIDKGICGKAVQERTAQIVADVHQNPYYIACSSSTQSEIVVPVFHKNGTIVAVLDADSNLPAAFDELDLQWLEKILEPLKRVYWI